MGQAKIGLGQKHRESSHTIKGSFVQTAPLRSDNGVIRREVLPALYNFLSKHLLTWTGSALFLAGAAPLGGDGTDHKRHSKCGWSRPRGVCVYLALLSLPGKCQRSLRYGALPNGQLSLPILSQHSLFPLFPAIGPEAAKTLTLDQEDRIVRKRQAFLKKVHQLDATLPSSNEAVTAEYLCSDGKAQIDVALPEGGGIFDPLSIGRQRDLNRDIYDYIDRRLYAIPTLYEIRVCFHGELPKDMSEEEIRAMFTEHYAFMFRDKEADLRINSLKMMGLALCGIVFLTLYFALELSNLKPLFMEFLSIMGTFALWEAVDCWLLERKALKMERLYAGQAVLSEVVFVP